MIEIEKKFILNKEEKKRIINNAQFLSEKTFTDTYYDTNDFSLIFKDYWLRFRDQKAELKIPLNQENHTFINQYEEIIDEDKIAEKLNIQKPKALIDSLKVHDYHPFCICKTTRIKRKSGLFTIDLDFVDFVDFTYNIAEIEIMVESQKEVESALEKINEFAKENNLKMESVRGKVIEYLKRKREKLYKELLRKGIVKE